MEIHGTEGWVDFRLSREEYSTYCIIGWVDLSHSSSDTCKLKTNEYLKLIFSF